MIIRAPDARIEGLPFVIVAENKKSQDTICPDWYYLTILLYHKGL